MRRAVLGSLLSLSACNEFNIGDVKDDGALPGVDTDEAAPLDSDPPLVESDEPDSAEPPNDDPLVATAVMYAHSNIALFSVDPVNTTVTRIGQFVGPGGAKVAMSDIAIDLQGHLYAGSYETTAGGRYTIWRVDPSTAAVTRVCDVGPMLTGMTFLSDGRLVLGAQHALTVVDLAAGCKVSELYRDNWLETSGDVVGLPDGKLYWTVTGTNGDDLMVVDPVAKTARRVGSVGKAQLYGLGYDEVTGKLYGFSSSNREIVVIDPATASASPFPVTDRQSWWGATTNPVVW